jgi:hypothetical protein
MGRANDLMGLPNMEPHNLSYNDEIMFRDKLHDLEV